MKTDGRNDDDLEATFAGYAAADPSPEDSGDSMVVVAQEPQVAVKALAETPVAVVEPAKTCCICGLDVSDKPRAHDQAGRFWCAHCTESSRNAAGKTDGWVPCPSCGRDTRPMLMVDQAGERVCKPCNDHYIAEGKHRLVHKATVTANPELEIRQQIQQMVKVIFAMAGLAGVVALYHFGWLYFRPRSWVPFQSALYFCGAMAVGMLIAIVVNYIRIALRKQARQVEYEEMVRAAANHVLALDEDSQTMGISESPEPLRRRVERAILRVEAYGGLGMPEAYKIIESLSKHSDAIPLIQFLQARRPSTTDTVARNREIATISYLQVDLRTSISAVTAILLRLQNDQDALSRHALISFRNGKLEEAKKIFKRVIFTAREKNSQIDLAAAYCNLGMLHMMLNEFDDASVRYSQAMVIYNKISSEDGQADCLLSLGIVAFKLKKWAEVEDQLRKAMAINRRRNRREGLAICCSLLGMILLEKEIPELKESKKLLTDAVRLNLELGRAGGVAAAYGNLGLVCVKREDFVGANELFLKALSIYQRINRPKMVAKIQGMLKTVGTLSTAKAARSKR